MKFSKTILKFRYNYFKNNENKFSNLTFAPIILMVLEESFSSIFVNSSLRETMILYWFTLTMKVYKLNWNYSLFYSLYCYAYYILCGSINGGSVSISFYYQRHWTCLIYCRHTLVKYDRKVKTALGRFVIRSL